MSTFPSYKSLGLNSKSKAARDAELHKLILEKEQAEQERDAMAEIAEMWRRRHTAVNRFADHLERNLWWSPAPPEARSRRSSLGKSPSLTARAAERVPVPLKGKGKEDVPGSSSSFRRANSDRSNGTPERSNGFNGTPERHYQPGAQAGQSGPRRAATPPHQPEEPAHLPTVLTPSARAPPEGGEVPPLLEHCVLLGASPQALDAAWAAAAPQLGAGGQLGLRCEPEKLVCFPAVPEVEALEHFCFPQLVPVACSLRDRAHPGGDPAGAPVLLGRTTFVLHTSKGHDALTDKLFGVCLYWDHPLLLSAAPPPPPRADAPPRADRERAGVRSVLVRSRRCLCLLSRVALFDLHVRALALIVRNEVARDAELIAAGAGAARAVGLSPASVRVLEEYFLARAAPPDAQRAQCALAVAGAELVFRWDAETLERQEEAASVRAGMALLFGHLSMRNVITALTAMLLERRVVVQCGDLAILTAITLALPYLLRPYRWVNAALPLVPPALDAFLAAPVPFVAGVVHAPAAGYEEGLVVVHVEGDRVLGAEGLPRSRALEDLEAKLAPPHEHLSQPIAAGRAPPHFPFRRHARAPDSDTAREVVDGMLLIMQSQVASLVSLRELWGLAIAGAKAARGDSLARLLHEGFSAEQRASFLRLVQAPDRAFVAGLLETSLLVQRFADEAHRFDPPPAAPPPPAPERTPVASPLLASADSRPARDAAGSDADAEKAAAAAAVAAAAAAAAGEAAAADTVGELRRQVGARDAALAQQEQENADLRAQVALLQDLLRGRDSKAGLPPDVSTPAGAPLGAGVGVSPARPSPFVRPPLVSASPRHSLSWRGSRNAGVWGSDGNAGVWGLDSLDAARGARRALAGGPTEPAGGVEPRTPDGMSGWT